MGDTAKIGEAIRRYFNRCANELDFVSSAMGLHRYRNRPARDAARRISIDPYIRGQGVKILLVDDHQLVRDG
jgi:hypothetical protein